MLSVLKCLCPQQEKHISCGSLIEYWLLYPIVEHDLKPPPPPDKLVGDVLPFFPLLQPAKKNEDKSKQSHQEKGKTNGVSHVHAQQYKSVHKIQWKDKCNKYFPEAQKLRVQREYIQVSDNSTKWQSNCVITLQRGEACVPRRRTNSCMGSQARRVAQAN